MPAGIQRIKFERKVAGTMFEGTCSPAPNQTAHFTWDGLDAYGCILPGRQSVSASIGDVYRGPHGAVSVFDSAFGSFGTGAISQNPIRDEITLTQTFTHRAGIMDAESVGLNGWILSSHHSYDEATGDGCVP